MKLPQGKNTKGLPPSLQSATVNSLKQQDPDQHAYIHMRVPSSFKEEVHTYAIKSVGSITELFKLAFNEYQERHPI